MRRFALVFHDREDFDTAGSIKPFAIMGCDGPEAARRGKEALDEAKRGRVIRLA
jgi:hypothetical protein